MFPLRPLNQEEEEALAVEAATQYLLREVYAHILVSHNSSRE